MADSSSAAVSHAPLRPHPQEYPQVDNSSAVDHPTGRSYRERRKIHENERREKMSSLEVAGDRALHGDYLSNLKKPPNNTTSVNDAKELLFSDFSLLRRASVEVQEEDVEHHGFLFSSPSRGLDMLPHRRRDTSNADSITRFSHPFSSQLIPIGAAGPSLTPSCQIDEENFLPSEEDLEPHNDWDVLRSDESSIQATDIIEEIILTFGSKKP